MPTEKILDLLDEAQALGFRERVGFHHYSEPLLDKRNIMLAREAKRRDMKPYLHTNGDALKHNDGLCKEVKEVYGLIVVGLYDYETTKELEETKLYWQDRLAGANLQFSPIGLLGSRSGYSNGIPKALVPPDPRMAIPDLTYTDAPCHRPLVRMIIQYDGDMALCVEDINDSFDLGNVYHSSLEELWFSGRHQKIIEDLTVGLRDKYHLCRNCPMSPTSPAPAGKKIGVSRRRQEDFFTSVRE